jgi:hypothetical protein
MTDDLDDREKDGRLTRWLREWATPPRPLRLDDRVLASYRAGRSRWRRFWGGRVSIPLPLAVLLMVALLTVVGLASRGFRAGRGAPAGGQTAVSGSGGLADLRPLPDVRLRVVNRDDQSGAAMVAHEGGIER